MRTDTVDLRQHRKWARSPEQTDVIYVVEPVLPTPDETAAIWTPRPDGYRGRHRRRSYAGRIAVGAAIVATWTAVTFAGLTAVGAW